MSHFLSFNFVRGAPTVADAVYAEPALRSHSGAEAHWHLNPSSYVECEWLGDDDGDTLTVRDGNGDTRMTRRAIFAAYPTRRALIDHLAARLGIGWDHEREVPVLPTGYHIDGNLDLGGCTGLTSLPDGLSRRVKGRIYR